MLTKKTKKKVVTFVESSLFSFHNLKKYVISKTLSNLCCLEAVCRVQNPKSQSVTKYISTNIQYIYIFKSIILNILPSECDRNQVTCHYMIHNSNTDWWRWAHLSHRRPQSSRGGRCTLHSPCHKTHRFDTDTDQNNVLHSVLQDRLTRQKKYEQLMRLMWLTEKYTAELVQIENSSLLDCVF